MTMRTKIKPELLKTTVFADSPANWFIHSQGFYQAGLKLIEAMEKLKPRNRKFISTEEVFHDRYQYKISIYLISHAIELALKAIISNCHLAEPGKFEALKRPIEYSHKVTDMVNDLIEMSVLQLTDQDEEYEQFKLVEEYLWWFGRYYCPQRIEKVVAQSYSKPDDQGLIEFKFQIKYPSTHVGLAKLYESLILPGAEAAKFQMHYLLHTP